MKKIEIFKNYKEDADYWHNQLLEMTKKRDDYRDKLYEQIDHNEKLHKDMENLINLKLKEKEQEYANYYGVCLFVEDNKARLYIDGERVENITEYTIKQIAGGNAEWTITHRG